MPEILHTGAELSDCGQYRYLLWRAWRERHGEPADLVLFLMLNPSTADADTDDATIRKCIGFAERWGNGGILVANLFALRAREPTELLKHEDPIGPGNDAVLERIFNGDTGLEPPSTVVLAWGDCGGPRVARLRRLRERDALRVMHRASPALRAVCLGHTYCGAPRHPLMLSYDTPQIHLPW